MMKGAGMSDGPRDSETLLEYSARTQGLTVAEVYATLFDNVTGLIDKYFAARNLREILKVRDCYEGITCDDSLGDYRYGGENVTALLVEYADMRAAELQCLLDHEASEKAAASRERAEAKRLALLARGLEVCDRCGGAGGWRGWPGFTCFKCHGECSTPIKARWFVKLDGTFVDYARTLKEARARAEAIGGIVWDTKKECERA
jgi:hypothetical protein